MIVYVEKDNGRIYSLDELREMYFNLDVGTLCDLADNGIYGFDEWLLSATDISGELFTATM